MTINKGRKNVFVLIATLFSLLCCFFIAVVFDWESVFSRIEEINYTSYGIKIIIIHLFYIFIRTVRFFILIRSAGVRCNLFYCYMITSIFVSISIFTPGQIGEAGKIEAMKKYFNMGRGVCLSVFAVEKVFDIIIIFIFGCIYALFSSVFIFDFKNIILILLLLIFIAYFFKILKYYEKINKIFGNVFFTAIKMAEWVYIFILSVSAWLFVGIAWKLSFYVVDVNVSLLDMLIIIFFVTFVSLISLVPGGLGVSDITISEILSRMGFDLVRSQSGALILRIYGLFVFVYGLVHFVLWVCFFYLKK